MRIPDPESGVHPDLIRGHQHPEGSQLVPLVDLVIGHELAQSMLERLGDPAVEPDGFVNYRPRPVVPWSSSGQR